MTVANTTVLEMLGKDVSFIHERKVELTDSSFITFTENFTGTVTNVVLSLTSEPEISINDGDFYVLSELTEFQVLDDCSAHLGTITKSPSAIDDHSIVDAAFTGLITDNKDFIDSLSK